MKKLLLPILFVAALMTACGSSEQKEQEEKNQQDSVMVNEREDALEGAEDFLDMEEVNTDTIMDVVEE